MSTISSRTPEGEPVKCPMCGYVFSALPSKPLMDTTCPSCGCLLVIEQKRDQTEIIAIVGSSNRRIAPSEILPEHEVVEEIADITPGKVVRIASGTWEGFVARVVSLDISNGSARVEIEVFGRVSTVIVSFADIIGY